MSDSQGIDGATRIYAVWGDPVKQVQTPRLINPLFAAAGRNIVAVPFHVRPEALARSWEAFRQMSNIAGIGVTVPHKIAAAALCDSMSEAARAVGAVNSIQRTGEGAMRGALFDGIGFVQGLGAARERLAGADVLLIGAGGAGRAIAHALAGEGLGRLQIVDLDPAAVEFTADMANRAAGAPIAGPADSRPGDATVWINATPMGLRPGDTFPVDTALLSQGTLVADIASLSRETELLKRARALGCATSDGNDMLNAQIALIAGFAAGLEPGEPLS